MTPIVCPAKLEKLLVCTDGSADSHGAFAAALDLAHSCGSRIYLIQVLTFNPEFEALAPELMEDWEKEVRENLEALKAEALQRGVTVETLVRRSESPYTAIIQEINRLQPDTVIIGRHGHKGISRVMMGSVTARVVGLSPKDVLVVPRHAAMALDRILLATDGSKYSKFATQRAIEFVKRGGGELNVVYVSDVPPGFYTYVPGAERVLLDEAQGFMDEVVKQAERNSISPIPFLKEGEAFEEITKLARERKANLIIMGSHGRTGFKKLLMGSVTEKVIGNATCPVLVVKAEHPEAGLA